MIRWQLFGNIVRNGKRTFALCDKQDAANQALIEAEVELLLMHDKKGIEALVLEGTTEEALQRFAGSLEWPPHLAGKYFEEKLVISRAYRKRI